MKTRPAPHQRPAPAVLGVTAARARPTRAGAVWLGLLIALPAGALLGVIELVWRLLR